jgi:hypothetical protein
MDRRASPKATWRASLGCLRAEYWRYRWRPESDDLRYRDHFLSISSQDRGVATGRFEEWDCRPRRVASIEDFVATCDALSHTAYETARAIEEFFPCSEMMSPFDYGSIVLFDRLQIQAKSANESSAVWEIIKKVLVGMRRAGTAGIILKAFPLEYEGQVTEATRQKFELRRKAMLRLYSTRLGTRTLEGALGEAGWQWLGIKSPF